MVKETLTKFGTYYVRTMATASFNTLSPNKRVYKSGSTCSSWKMASTVTKKKHIQIHRVSRDTAINLSLVVVTFKNHSLNSHLRLILYTHPLYWIFILKKSDWRLLCLWIYLGSSLLTKKVWVPRYKSPIIYTLCLSFLISLKPHWTLHNFLFFFF